MINPYVFTVDDEDLAYILNYKWRKSGKGYWYKTFRKAPGGEKTNIKLERFLLLRYGIKLDSKLFEVDHIDFDISNASKVNIRLISSSLNKLNKPSLGSSLKLAGNYRAGCKKLDLGHHSTLEKAFEIYIAAKKNLFKELMEESNLILRQEIGEERFNILCEKFGQTNNSLAENACDINYCKAYSGVISWADFEKLQK